MRLIDADALKNELSDKDYITYTHEYGDAIPVDWIMNAIDNAPTVERPKGKWRFYGLCFSTTQYQCNKCEYLTLEKTNFCPRCGADMKKEANDE